MVPSIRDHIILASLLFTVPATGLTQVRPQVVAADSPHATPAGATFAAPAQWSIADGEASVTMQSPDGDTHLLIVDVRGENAAAAVASAWKSFRADFNRPVRAEVAVADRDGWKDGKQFIYETSPNERELVIAVALHAAEDSAGRRAQTLRHTCPTD